MIAKAQGVALAAQAAIAANPMAAGAAATVVAAAITEKVTRYEDEKGNTKHRCAIM